MLHFLFGLLGKINTQNHPILLLNHLFHETTGLSYKTVLSQKDEDEKLIKYLDSLPSDDKYRRYDELSEGYTKTCRWLIEQLKSPTDSSSQQLETQANNLIDRINKTPYYDRPTLFAKTRQTSPIRPIQDTFYDLISNFIKSKALEQYGEMIKSQNLQQDSGKDRLIDLQTQANQILGQNANNSNNSAASSSQGPTQKIKDIEHWRDAYYNLSPEQAVALTQMLNKKDGDTNSSVADITQTVEYRIADLYDTLLAERRPAQTPKNASIRDSFNNISEYLVQKLDNNQFKVIPDSTTPASEVRASGTITILNNENDQAPTQTIRYAEHQNDNGQIALISNSIHTDVDASKVKTILDEQINYLQHCIDTQKTANPDQQSKKVSDDFVFRIDFKSQQQYDTFLEKGKMQKMLESFSSSEGSSKLSDFKVKIVIKASNNPENNSLHDKVISYNSIKEFKDKALQGTQSSVPVRPQPLSQLRSNSKIHTPNSPAP